MSVNADIANQLNQIAALLDEQGVAFKPAAYRRAAQTIEELPKDVTTYGDVKELKKLPGIGDAIASKIVEYRDTGKIKFLVDLLAEQGGLSAALMDVEGLGPKKVRQLERELGISTVAQLIDAAERGKLQKLARWDELSEKKVLEHAKRAGERVKRFTLAEIKDDVELLLKTIKKVPGVTRVAVAGSYRRQKETVGDIDVLAVTNNAKKIGEAISKLPIVRNVAAHGDTKISFDLKNGIRVDVRMVKANQWGAALLYFTGSKEHNIEMRKIAIKKGWKLNEYALTEGEKIIASKEEKDIYKALGLRYYEPTERKGGL